jgi:hypothetical protein
MADTYALHFAANGTVNGTTFLNAAGGNTAPAAVTAVPGVWLMVDDGTIDLMFVRHSNPSGAFTPVYTVFLNGVATTLTVSLASATAQGSDIVNSFAVVRGDRVAVQCVANTTLATLRINVTMRFTRAGS